jgi:2-alkyl-3-oxoalkanoate reductase
MRAFVAGAAGAIGKRLIPQLVAAGHQVTATTRSPGKVEELRRLGATPLVVDGLDRSAVMRAVARSAPDAIVHQMTALAGRPDLRRFDNWFATTNQLRTRGTDILLAAAQKAGVNWFVAQSYTGWTNPRTGGPVKEETDGLDPHPSPQQRESLTAIHYLERTVLAEAPEGIVLRYGNFYGPGGSDDLVALVRKRRFPIIGDGTGVWSWIHLDDAGRRDGCRPRSWSAWRLQHHRRRPRPSRAVAAVLCRGRRRQTADARPDLASTADGRFGRGPVDDRGPRLL